jgi:hypothetical protein
MKDFSELLNSYRDCVRHLWNTYFSHDACQNSDWELHESFIDISDKLFRTLVIYKIGNLFGNYSSDTEELSIKVVPKGECPILINRDIPATGYWDDPIKCVKESEVNMKLIGCFDWDDLGFREFEFYRVRITASEKYPHLIGRDALVKPMHIRILV